jgi:hypothetical protein
MSAPAPGKAARPNFGSPSSEAVGEPLSAAEEHRQRMRAQVEEENRLLDVLHNSIVRSGQKADTMHRELGTHVDMMGHLGANIDAAQDEVSRQTRGVTDILKDERHKHFYMLACVMILIIVALLAI